MESNNKGSRLYRLLRKEWQWKKIARELGIYISVLVPMLLTIIPWRLYHEAIFYFGMLAIVGWVFLLRVSIKFKARYSSGCPKILVDCFVVLAGLGTWSFFSYILGNELGGGQFVLVALVAFLFSFGGVLLVWRVIEIILDLFRRSRSMPESTSED